MAKSRPPRTQQQQDPSAKIQDPSAEPTVRRDGEVVLLQDSIDARGKPCRAGMVIAPDVEGWPAHRVAQHIRNGVAK